MGGEIVAELGFASGVGAAACHFRHQAHEGVRSARRPISPRVRFAAPKARPHVLRSPRDTLQAPRRSAAPARRLAVATPPLIHRCLRSSTRARRTRLLPPRARKSGRVGFACTMAKISAPDPRGTVARELPIVTKKVKAVAAVRRKGGLPATPPHPTLRVTFSREGRRAVTGGPPRACGRPGRGRRRRSRYRRSGGVGRADHSRRRRQPALRRGKRRPRRGWGH